MAWIYLIISGFCEIGWPLGLKLAQTTKYVVPSVILSIVSMLLSGILLFVAQKHIPIGTAYAVWTGIGAVGTYLVGVMLFNDATSVYSWLGICLIISGIVLLKLNH